MGVIGFRVIGFGVIGFRVIGFRVIGFKVLGGTFVGFRPENRDIAHWDPIRKVYRRAFKHFNPGA